MDNGNENTDQNNESEINIYICMTKFREPLLNSIIKSLKFQNGSKGLDAGCAIGYITKLLAETVGKKGSIIGLDLSNDFIHYAKKNYQTEKRKCLRNHFFLQRVVSLCYLPVLFCQVLLRIVQ